MKKFVCVGMIMLALSVNSFGDILVGDFEAGSSDGWWVGWGTTITPVEGNATLGTGSMEAVSGGGWVETMEAGFFGTPAQTALGTVGTITMDVTTSWNEDDGTYSWAPQIAIIVNCNDLWNAYDYQSVAVNGATQSFTFQLPGDAMAALLAAWEYANFGILSNSPESVWSDPDPITGETTLLYQGGATHYYDNIQVVVPEPTTLVLLGLGSLVIRRKRS